jgi:hypothetical protein
VRLPVYNPAPRGGIEDVPPTVEVSLRSVGLNVQAELGDGHCFRRSVAKQLSCCPGAICHLILQELEEANENPDESGLIRYLSGFSLKSPKDHVGRRLRQIKVI